MAEKKTVREPSAYEFWNNVTLQLKNKRMSLGELSEKTGIRYQTLVNSRWSQSLKSQNNQNNSLRSKMVVQIAKALETTPDTLLYGESTLDEEMEKNRKLEMLEDFPLTEILRESESLLTPSQMKNIFEHALSYFDITIDSLESNQASDRENDKKKRN